MNKKLIALAVAGALGVPMVASADASSVTIFGRVGAEFGSTKIDRPSTDAANYRQETIGDNTGISRYGLDIKEDLGNGLSAIARIENEFRTGNGTTQSAREQWVGLSSKSWGSAKFGRVQSPFKDFAGGTGLDPFVATNLQARGSGGAMYAPANGFGASSFVDHAVRYDSPAFGGFSLAILLSPSDATQADPTGPIAVGTGGGATAASNQGNVGGKGGANNYQIGLKYKFGASGEIFGGYSNDDANDAQKLASANGRFGDDEEVWRIGAKWTFGDFTVAGQYEDISNALAGNGGTTCGNGPLAAGRNDNGISTAQCNTSLNTNGDGDIWFLTAQYKLGKTTLVLQGGKTTADAVGTAVKKEAKNITLGAIYNFSKRTRVFGGYQRVSVDGSASAGLNGVAAVSSTQATVNAATQPDRSTWTIGMRHDF